MAAVDISSNELSATARPAEPLLASHLIDDEELDELLESVCNATLGRKEKSEKERLQTGVKSLDDALGGELQSGRVVEVSGEVGAGASEVSKLNVTVIQNYMAKDCGNATTIF
jgi:predicted ATP-dependent serine protease